MKKTFTKALTLLVALCMALTCGGIGASAKAEAQAESHDWIGFHGWMDEEWDAKEAAYQFTGYWDMGDPEYGISFSFLMNLYQDGSVLVNQYQEGRVDYRYYGSWELIEDPDCNELHIGIVEESGGEIEGLLEHGYSYTVYEETDGTYTFGYDFGIAGGQYFRVADLTGSAKIEYGSVDAFQEAAAAGTFAASSEPADAAAEAPAEDEAAVGYTATVDLGGQDFEATLVLIDETTAALTAAVSFNCLYEKLGNAVILTPAGELEGFQVQIWPGLPHVLVIDDGSMTMKGATAAYDAAGLALITFGDGTMRVEFPQYSMLRDGFTYTLSEDGRTLTVTGTPGADIMGAFQQVWDAMGGETWTIDGNTAVKAE